jgi:hypothetical protein
MRPELPETERGSKLATYQGPSDLDGQVPRATAGTLAAAAGPVGTYGEPAGHAVCNQLGRPVRARGGLNV